MKTYARPALLMCAVLAPLCGCMTGPDYSRPETPEPKTWSEPMAGGETDAAAPPEQWWTVFDDATLTSLIARAAAGNQDLRIAEARIRQARALIDVTEAGLWPQVDTSAAYQRVQTKKIQTSATANGAAAVTLSQQGVSITASPAGASGPSVTIVPDLSGGGNGSVTVRSGSGSGQSAKRQASVWQAGFDASWELDVFGGTRREIEAARADTQAAEEARRGIFVTLAAEVARNYFELRGAQNRIDTAKANIEAQREALEIARARFAAGLTSELDATIAEAQLASSQSTVPLLETAAQLAIHRLGVLSGTTPGALMEELSPSAALAAAPPEVPVGLPADMVRRRPDVRQAERNVAAATARIGVAMADLYPRFVLTGSLTGSSDAFEGITRGANRLWSFGPGIRWPLFDGGRIRANIRVQNARQEEVLAAYEKTVLLSLEDVENALVAYAKEQNRYVSLTEAVEANRRAVTLAKELYARGLVNFLSVLDAERSLFAAEDQQIQSRAAVLANLVALYKALGGGWQSAYPEQ